MGTCDVCGNITTWDEGTAYTADDFRALVDLGFEPPLSVLRFLGPAGIQGWKSGLVATSTTGWLLCPLCSQRAAEYLPRQAGTGPQGHVLAEIMPTAQMLGLSQDAPPVPAPPPVQVLRDQMKECPTCCQAIASAATICPNCGANFTVTFHGYCSTERGIVAADEHGKCIRCGTDILDFSVESQMIAAGIITSPPAISTSQSPADGESIDPTIPACAACHRSFNWDDAYQSQNTPGSTTHNPSGHGVFRPRAYCPHCGALVAEWHIDRYKDYDEWSWYGMNATLNSGKDLPPNPLLAWGKGIPVALLPTIEEDHLAVDQIQAQEGVQAHVESDNSPEAIALARQAEKLLNDGEIEEAAELFERAGVAGMKPEDYAYCLGATGVYYLYKRGDVENAYRYCRRSVDLEQAANWQACYVLSLIYSGAEESEKARIEMADAQRFAGTVWWEEDFERKLKTNLDTWIAQHGKAALQALFLANVAAQAIAISSTGGLSSGVASIAGEESIPEGSKVCPSCGKVIKLDAVLCRFCRARFSLVEKGYCSTCHQLVEPSTDGKCPVCQCELLDRRKISQIVVESAPALATPPPITPLVAQITCHKCQSTNPGGQTYCQSCKTNLLPGEGFLMHIAYFVGGVVLTALDVWLLKAVMEGSITLNLVCLKPGFLIVSGLAMLVWGFVKMVTPTPRFQRYADRAARHMDKNLLQALADTDAALSLAPKGERPGLLKKREEIHSKLGATQDVLRDQLELALDPETHRTGANLMSMLNMDGDVYADSSSKQDRQTLISSGKVKAFGYCKHCHAAVELNKQLKCSSHGSVKAIQYAIRGDEAIGKQKVMDEVGRLHSAAKNRRNLALAVLILMIGAWFVINYFNDKPTQPGQPTALPVMAQIAQATSTPLPASTATPAIASATQEIMPVLFDDHQVSFEYPSNWQVIDEAGVQTLLQGTLKGIGDWDYIGGVYTKAPDDCTDCAHITVAIIPLPEGYPGWSDEFYERIKQNAQNSMGDRLLLHRQVMIGDYPGWETIYLGKSGRTKLWDKSYLPTDEAILVMVSASTSPEQFDQFLPFFEQAYSTLSVYGASESR